jgi:hypothetical protein
MNHFIFIQFYIQLFIIPKHLTWNKWNEYLVFNANYTIYVEVYRPHNLSLLDDNNNNSTDLAIIFVDWAIYPQDFNMGL